MVPPLEESEDEDRVSFSRWEKRNVVSHHFTELVIYITETEMLSNPRTRLYYKLMSSFLKISQQNARAKTFSLSRALQILKTVLRQGLEDCLRSGYQQVY